MFGKKTQGEIRELHHQLKAILDVTGEKGGDGRSVWKKYVGCCRGERVAVDMAGGGAGCDVETKRCVSGSCQH